MAFTDVPVVPRKTWGLACLLLNIFIPGTGTMVAAGNQERVKHLVFGILQFVFFWTILGWIWSIVWGVLIFLRSQKSTA